jgi:MFS family permease
LSDSQKNQEEKSAIAANLRATYVSGLFSMGQAELLTFIVPLWAVLQGASPTEIGALVGARSLLTFFLAIHGGALMDRLGTRRVMLFFTAMTGLLAAVYPLLPWLAVMLILQMLIGFASNMTWIGAQTMIAQVTGGDAGRIGTFSFYSRIGTILAPLMMGLLWDLTGPHIAFLGIACWSSCMFLAVSQIQNPQKPSDLIGRISWRDIVPKVSDYRSSLKLALVPAVAFTLAISFTRHATNAAESSFLIVYLQGLGYTGTIIGALFSVTEIFNGLGSLCVRFFSRRSIAWLMIGFTASSIVLLALTPLFGGIFILLAIAHGIRRLSEGIVQPLMFSLQTRAVPREVQGSIVGLRVTNNRLASILTPVAMGVIVEFFGIEAGFYIMGVLLFAICIYLAITVAKYRIDEI